MSYWDIVHIGSHVGDCYTDKIFDSLSSDQKIIFIEPIKVLFDKLVENCNRIYPKNNFVFLNYAVSNKNGTLDMYVPDIDIFSNVGETTSHYSQILPEWVDQLASVHKNHVNDHNLNLGVKKVEVPCFTLNHLFRQYQMKGLELLYIDTEGHDFEIIWDINFDIMKPERIFFEHKHMEGTNKKVGKRYNQLLEHLFQKGYRVVYTDHENTEVGILKY